MTKKKRPEGEETELNETPETNMEDPIGDETDGEGEPAAESEEDAELEDAEGEGEEEADLEEQEEAEEEDSDEEDSEEDDSDEDEEEEEEEDAEDSEGDESEPEFKAKARPPANLERLQKILAQSGVASRRKAEEMIEQGRVQVNGK